LDEENCLVLTAGLMLKYLSSCATADRMVGFSASGSELAKLKESPAAALFLPNIGSCFTAPPVFFSVGD